MRATTEVDCRISRVDSKGLAVLEVRPLADLFGGRGGFQCGACISYIGVHNMQMKMHFLHRSAQHALLQMKMDGAIREYGMVCTSLHYVLNKAALVLAQSSQFAHV